MHRFGVFVETLNFLPILFVEMKRMNAKKVVVYIDDDEQDLEIFSTMLSSIADAPLLKTFQEPEDALRFFKNDLDQHYNLCMILVDINLPNTNGYDVILKIRALEKLGGTDISFLTTSSNPKDKARAEAIGVGFITKPDRVDEIQTLAREIVEHCNGL